MSLIDCQYHFNNNQSLSFIKEIWPEVGVRRHWTIIYQSLVKGTVEDAVMTLLPGNSHSAQTVEWLSYDKKKAIHQIFCDDTE